MILTKEKRDALVDKIDELIKFPAWVEMWDGAVMKAALKWLDESYGDKVPEEFKDDINSIVDFFIAGDYENIVLVATPQFLDQIINIPGLDEETEDQLMAVLVKAIFEIIKYYAKGQIKK